MPGSRVLPDLPWLQSAKREQCLADLRARVKSRQGDCSSYSVRQSSLRLRSIVDSSLTQDFRQLVDLGLGSSSPSRPRAGNLSTPDTNAPAAGRRKCRRPGPWPATRRRGRRCTRTTNSLNVGCWKASCSRPPAVKRSGRIMGLLQAEVRHVGQAGGAHRGQVDRRANGQQGLVRADVARGLVAADVLLAGLQRQAPSTAGRGDRRSARPGGRACGGGTARGKRGCPGTAPRIASACPAIALPQRRYRPPRRPAA